MLFSIELPWKSFNVNLQWVESYVNSLTAGPHYAGCSADTKLTLWFRESLSAEDAQEVTDYWESLTEESAEAMNYVSQDQITARIEELKADMLSKSWDEMSLAQRKILMNQSLSNTELGF